LTACAALIAPLDTGIIFRKGVIRGATYERASRAKDAPNQQEAARFFELAIRQLCKTVRDLEDRIDSLESRR
jgi:hypothetical protein